MIITTSAPIEINEVHDRSPLILDDISMGIWLSDDNSEYIHENISHGLVKSLTLSSDKVSK